MVAQTTEDAGSNSKKRRIRAYIGLSVIILGVVITGWIWYRQYSSYYSTDDAFVDADKVAVSAKMMGRINHLYADEGDSVKQGQILVELDSTDLVAQKIQAMAACDQAVSALQQAEARLELDRKNTLVQEINVARAKEDYDRATAQIQGKVISQEQFDHAKKNWESLEAQLEASHAQVDVSKSQVGMAESSIKTANAQIGTIITLLGNTRIYAPATGRIARRWLLPGDVVQPGQSVMTITRDNHLWVTALFEETKVTGLRIGQEAQFTVDAWPGAKFAGKIFYIGSSTASQFSLIPPNNASGNFTKVTQRIPLKISIDNSNNYEQGKNDPPIRLAAGMSVIVRIYKEK